MDIIKSGTKVILKKIWHQEELLNLDTSFKGTVIKQPKPYQCSVIFPVNSDEETPVRVGEQFYLRFFTDTGAIQTKSIIVEILRNEKNVRVLLKLLSDPVFYKRRQHYRLVNFSEIRYRVLNSNDETKTAQLIDISGGGLRFSSEEPVAVESTIEIFLDKKVFNVDKPLETLVVYSKEMKNDANRFDTRTKIVNMEEQEKEKLIRSIFIQAEKQ